MSTRAGLAEYDTVVASLPALDSRARAVLGFVGVLTVSPRRMRASALVPLREAGFTDREIHDIVHVVACFSYMNRLADGTGVTVQTGRRAWACTLLGEDSLAAHLAWAAGEVSSED